MGVWHLASRRVTLLSRNLLPRCPKMTFKLTTFDHNSSRMEIYNKVTEQGDKIRELKAAKADKAEITQAVQLLKDLKLEYSETTGQEYEKGILPGETPSTEGPMKSTGGDIVTPWDVQAEVSSL